MTSATYPNLAQVYNEFSSHHFIKSEYHEVKGNSLKCYLFIPHGRPAGLYVGDGCDEPADVDVLRQVSKFFVVKQ